TDGVRMMRRLGEPDRLGCVFRRLSESAEPREALNEQVAIEDRWRCSESQILVDPIDRQRREVVDGQLDYALELALEQMHLRDVMCGEYTKPQIPDALGDLQRAGAGHERLIQLSDVRVGGRHERVDPAAPKIVVDFLGKGLRLAETLLHRPEFI